MRRQDLRRIGLVAALIGFFAAGEPTIAGPLDEAIAIELRAQPLGDALRELAKVSGVQILFDPELVAARHALPLAGTLTPRGALQQLLQGTGLEAHEASPGALVIRMRAAAVVPIATSPASPGASDETVDAIAENAASTALEEVVVTAQKREESLQDVPIAITAVSGDALRESGLVRLEDLSATVPDLTISQSVSSSDNMFLRGVGSGVNLGFEQAVGQVIDGFFYGRSRFGRAAFLDVERVEVLKGPQGALIGKNTSAGAINITTAKPTKTFGAWIAPSYEAEGDSGFTVEGAVFGPLTETLTARLTARFENHDGFVDNVATGEEEQSRDDVAARLTMRWEPSQTFNATIAYQYGDYDREGQHREISKCSAALPGFLAANGISEDCALNYRRNVLYLRGGVPRDETFRTEFETFGLTANWQLAGHTLTSLTGYARYDANDELSTGMLPLELGSVETGDDYEQWSQELRIASDREGRLQYIGGLFLQSSDQDTQFTVHFPSAPPLLRGSRNILSTQSSDTAALFAQATWELTERLSATVSGRYTREEKEADQRQFSSQLYTLVPVTLPGGPAALQHTVARDRTESDFSPGLTLQWRPQDDLMVYGSVRRGFKGGGFDLQLNANQADALASFEFESEEVTAYELGAKMLLLDRTAEINAALFRSDFDDLQVSTLTDAVSFNVGNAASAITQGLEIDTRWLVRERLTLTALLAYLDAEYDEYRNAPCYEGQIAAQGCIGRAQDLSGRQLQFAPEWSAAFSGEYVWPLANSLELVGFARLIYRDEAALALDLDPNMFQESYVKLDAHVTLRAANNRWAVSVIGRNLNDETTSSFGNDITGPPAIIGSHFRFAEPPRSIVIQARLQF